MDGYIAHLPAICALAEKHDGLVMVDDSHATGFMGKSGRGTHEYHNVMGRVDIMTGTLGKALGGPAAVIPADGRKSSSICGNARGPICFPIRSPRPSPPARSKRWH